MLVLPCLLLIAIDYKAPSTTQITTDHSTNFQTLPTALATMLRTITRIAFTKNLASASAVRVSSRTMASKNIEDATQAAGEAKDTNPKVCPSHTRRQPQGTPTI